MKWRAVALSFMEACRATKASWCAATCSCARTMSQHPGLLMVRCFTASVIKDCRLGAAFLLAAAPPELQGIQDALVQVPLLSVISQRRRHLAALRHRTPDVVHPDRDSGLPAHVAGVSTTSKGCWQWPLACLTWLRLQMRATSHGKDPCLQTRSQTWSWPRAPFTA